MEGNFLEILIPVFLGIGLSAATGIRLFLPFFIISLCKYFNLFEFGYQFEWLNGESALIALGVATLVEIAGYYIPLVDHLLDLVATPLAFVAGIVSMTSVMPDLPVYIDNILGVIIGGGTAVTMNSFLGFWRVKTTASMAGVANPVFATIENILSGLFTFLAFLIPVILGIAILVLLISSFRFVQKLFRKKRARHVVTRS